MIYKSLIRPKLEYANVIWSPLLQKHKDMLEKVQRRCTKFGPLTNLSYRDRLIQLGLTSLETRRNRSDLIQMFKYVKGFDKLQFVDPPKFLTNNTRGHKYKFIGDKPNKIHRARSSFFLNRFASDWNKLPKSVLEAISVDDFKNRIDKLDQFQVGC